MPINIHGKEYFTVAERVQALHDSSKEEDNLAIESEVLAHNPVVVKATVRIKDSVFTGISAANPSKFIEKHSPYEVAETLAVGRALGFAGFGLVNGLATADEMVKAEHTVAVAEHRHVNKSLVKPSRTISEFESGEYCKKCNSNNITTKISNTKANPSREFRTCVDCKAFCGWTDETQVDPEMASLAATM